MKTLVLAIAVLLILPCCQPQENKPDLVQEKQAVHKVMADFFTALETRDWNMLRTSSTNDAYIIENGLLWTNDSLIYAMENEWADCDISYKFDFIRTEVEGKMAYMLYENHAIVTTPDDQIPFHWRESLIFKKIDGQWKLVLGHSTVIPDKK